MELVRKKNRVGGGEVIKILIQGQPHFPREYIVIKSLSLSMKSVEYKFNYTVVDL